MQRSLLPGPNSSSDASTALASGATTGADVTKDAVNFKTSVGLVEDLFVLKCKLCGVIFSMEANDYFAEAKEAKR